MLRNRHEIWYVLLSFESCALFTCNLWILVKPCVKTPGKNVGAVRHSSCVLIVARWHAKGSLYSCTLRRQRKYLYSRHQRNNCRVMLQQLPLNEPHHVFHFTYACPQQWKDISAIPTLHTHPSEACTLGTCLTPLTLERLCYNKTKPPTTFVHSTGPLGISAMLSTFSE